MTISLTLDWSTITDVAPEDSQSIRITSLVAGAQTLAIVGRLPLQVRDAVVAILGATATGPRARRLDRRADVAVDLWGQCSASFDPRAVPPYLWLGWPCLGSRREHLISIEGLPIDVSAEIERLIAGRPAPAGRCDAVPLPPATPIGHLDEIAAAASDGRRPDEMPSGSWSPRPHQPVDAGEFAKMTHARHVERRQ